MDEEAWTKLEDGCWIPKGGLEIRVDVHNVSADLQESVCGNLLCDVASQNYN